MAHFCPFRACFHSKRCQGERPLRRYSRDMTAAWEVTEKMNITLIPVEDHNWFAMVGKDERFKGPAEFLL
jgi:hypothetical protein